MIGDGTAVLHLLRRPDKKKTVWFGTCTIVSSPFIAGLIGFGWHPSEEALHKNNTNLWCSCLSQMFHFCRRKYPSCSASFLSAGFLLPGSQNILPFLITPLIWYIIMVPPDVSAVHLEEVCRCIRVDKYEKGDVLPEHASLFCLYILKNKSTNHTMAQQCKIPVTS